MSLGSRVRASGSNFCLLLFWARTFCMEAEIIRMKFGRFCAAPIR